MSDDLDTGETAEFDSEQEVAPITEVPAEEPSEEPVAKSGPPGRMDEVYAMYKSAQEAERAEEQLVSQEHETFEEEAPAELETSLPEVSEPMYDITVDGVKEQISASDLVAREQMTRAADKRLQEAKDLLAQMKAEQAAIRDLPVQQPPARDPEPTEQATPVLFDDEELESYVESMQIGDSEEGREATKNLLNKMVTIAQANQQAPQEPVDVKTEVQQSLIQARQQENVNGAINRFIADNEDIVNDEQATAIMKMSTIRTLKSDLRGIGYTEKQVNDVGDNIDLLAQAHGYQALHGRVRSYDEVLDISAKNTRAIYAPLTPPEPAQESQEVTRRTAEKERMQQPKHGTTRNTTPKKARVKSDKEKLNEYRRARGFPTV